MSELTLGHFLNRTAADADTVQQVLRYYISERSDDISTEEQLRCIVERVGDQRKANEAIRRLELEPAALESLALMVLSYAWEEDGQAGLIREVTDDAKGKLPVIETAILSIAAMYGMYLIVTGGIRRSTHTTVRAKDGRYTTTEIKEYSSFSEPVKAVFKLFDFKPEDTFHMDEDD